MKKKMGTCVSKGVEIVSPGDTPCCRQARIEAKVWTTLSAMIFFGRGQNFFSGSIMLRRCYYLWVIDSMEFVRVGLMATGFRAGDYGAVDALVGKSESCARGPVGSDGTESDEALDG